MATPDAAQPTPAPAPTSAASSDRSAPFARTPPAHRWTFHRVGGLDQVVLTSGDDLAHLATLDQKLWVALSCPTRGLELDPRTLDLLDTDRDGRVRAPEVLAAIQWCRVRLRSLDALVPGGPELPLDAIDEGTPEGRAVLAAAQRILRHRGREGADALTPADVADTSRVFEDGDPNGDGIVAAEAVADPAVRQVLADALACVGGVRDRSGREGIDRARLDTFFRALAERGAWLERGRQAELLALGARSAAAWEAIRAVAAKVDDWFARCRFAAVDPRAAARMNRSEDELAVLAAQDLSRAHEALATFPLARVEPDRPLPLTGPVNPAWASALEALRRDAVAPVYGAEHEALTAAEWQAIQARLAPYAAWAAEQVGPAVAKLGAERVRGLLAGSARADAEAVLARDLAAAPEAAAVDDAVRLVLYRRDLYRLLRNFVNFADFYAKGATAIFQAGRLYLDGRSCDLCVRVEDPAAHSALASLSRMYIAYCECRRPAEAPMRIAACFTQGDSDYLMVGRNGIFYDRQGRDWDATIVRIVDNPISLRQAFWSPYKKAVRLVEEQVARFAAAKQKENDGKLADTIAKPLEPKAVDVGKMVGIVAALGVGIGAVGTVLGGLVSGFMGLVWWAKGVALLAMVLLVSGPAVLIAWIKLRQRTLGPVLDANGWAVNGRVAVNVPLGTMLTARAVLPRNADRTLRDPYADDAARRRRLLFWLAAVLVAAAAALARWYRVWPFQ